MARLIMIRHGQSVANAERRFTHGPEEPLTEQGRAQARTTGALLRRCFAPTVLYSSPYRRALDTARLVGESLGLEPEVLEALHEQSFGELHGEPYQRYVRELAERTVSLWQLRPPGGETLEEVARRAGSALDRLAVKHSGEEVVVVSHGGVMAALRGHVAGGFESPPVNSENAGGFVLEHRAGGYAGPFPLEEA